MLKTLGILIGAGYDFDELIDKYSFEQIGLLAAAVMSHKIDLFNMAAEPLMAAMGGEFKPGKVAGETRRRPKKGSHRNADYATDAQKEAAMLRAIGSAPVRVRTRQVSPEAPPEG